MSENTLAAVIRKKTGKKISKALRREGKIPGIYYIHGEESVPLTLEAKQVTSTIASKPALISLTMDDGSKKEAVIRQVQRDPVTASITHVDFMGITRGVKITVAVPVRLEGEPEGIKLGGILEHTVRELEIECMPRNMPDTLVVDVSGLELGDSVHVRDLSYENIRILTLEDVAIASISLPKVVVEVTEEEVEEVEEAAEAEAPTDTGKAEEPQKSDKDSSSKE